MLLQHPASHGEKYSLRVPVSRILCVLRELRFTDKILSERHTGLSFLFHYVLYGYVRDTGVTENGIRV